MSKHIHKFKVNKRESVWGWWTSTSSKKGARSNRIIFTEIQKKRRPSNG